jgi:hypothetical protein
MDRYKLPRPDEMLSRINIVSNQIKSYWKRSLKEILKGEDSEKILVKYLPDIKRFYGEHSLVIPNDFISESYIEIIKHSQIFAEQLFGNGTNTDLFLKPHSPVKMLGILLNSVIIVTRTAGWRYVVVRTRIVALLMILLCRPTWRLMGWRVGSLSREAILQMMRPANDVVTARNVTIMIWDNLITMVSAGVAPMVIGGVKPTTTIMRQQRRPVGFIFIRMSGQVVGCTQSVIIILTTKTTRPETTMVHRCWGTEVKKKESVKIKCYLNTKISCRSQRSKKPKKPLE